MNINYHDIIISLLNILTKITISVYEKTRNKTSYLIWASAKVYNTNKIKQFQNNAFREITRTPRPSYLITLYIKPFQWKLWQKKLHASTKSFGVSQLRTKWQKTCELRTKHKKATYELRTQMHVTNCGQMSNYYFW